MSLELSDTRVYEPQTRARLATTAHFCVVVVLKLGSVHVLSTLAWQGGAGNVADHPHPPLLPHLPSHGAPRLRTTSSRREILR